MRPSRQPYPGEPAGARHPPARIRWAPVTATAALVLAGLLLGGCGHSSRVPAAGRVQVFLLEYRLRPDRITARRGELALVVHNLGRLTHNLSISRGGKGIASTPPIPPGGSARLSVNLAAGTYRIASTVEADQALGLRGMLTVTGN